ncbi:MAG: M81 family metallopeptidase [Sphingobium sp.]
MPVTPPGRPLRVLVAALAHETNSFSPVPTGLHSFQQDGYYLPPVEQGREGALKAAGYGDAIRIARARGDEVIEGPCLWTQPSAPVSAPLYRQLRDALLQGLRDAGPLDIVLLVFHGAMMAQGTDDCEGDLLAAVREIVGPETPVGALFDLHGNVSQEMVRSGAILVGVKEYPHIDYGPRAEELYAMLVDMARRGARLTVDHRTIPVLTLQGTTDEPMRSFVQRLKNLEGTEGIRSITLMHGFPWADWEQSGGSVLIVSEDANSQKMDALADELAGAYLEIVNGFPVERLSVAEAVRLALAEPAGKGPVVIADSSDNPGGGAACDSTFLLRELIDRQCRNVALGMIWDAQATMIAADAGVGARLHLRVGGKVGPLSGDPVDLEVEVLSVRPDVQQRFFSTVANRPLGLAVGLRAGEIELVVNSVRQQVFGPECFTELGIDVTAKDIVVVKSSQHFRACFDPIARATIYCNAPGSLNMDLRQMPYRHVRIASGDAAFALDRPVLRTRCPEMSGAI